MEYFSKIAPHLTNPFVLVGFVLMLVFGIHKALIKSNILQTVSVEDSSKIVRIILRYGFTLSILIICFGFGYAAWKTYLTANSEKVLTRLDVEEILQKNRGSIERCIKNDSILFLNFFFSQSKDGGISVDVLAGKELSRVPFWHSRLPSGVYDWAQLSNLLDSLHLEYSKPPTDIDVSKRLYFIPGNTLEQNPIDQHAVVSVAELGNKLSVTNPDANECVISLLKSSFKDFNALPSGSPFLHRYITDMGVKRSTPELNDQ